jgi:hypothetical protein
MKRDEWFEPKWRYWRQFGKAALAGLALCVLGAAMQFVAFSACLSPPASQCPLLVGSHDQSGATPCVETSRSA